MDSEQKLALSSPPRLIGIYAPASGSGKSAVGDFFLHRYGYDFRVQFSEPLKAMFCTLAEAAGVDPVVADRTITGDFKECPLPNLGGLSFREFAERVGNGRDCGRGRDPDLWVLIWLRKVMPLLVDGYSIVVDDLRYPNEYEAVRALGGRLIKVVRRGRTPTHPSEGKLDDHAFDDVITNDGTLDDLNTFLLDLMVDWERRRDSV